jgi:shikimate kinase
MQQGIVVWLQGSPELLARRVAKDGLEKRPLLAEGTPSGTGETEFYDIAHKKVTALLSERWEVIAKNDIARWVVLDGIRLVCCAL